MAGSTRMIRAARIVADDQVIQGGSVTITDGVIIDVLGEPAARAGMAAGGKAGMGPAAGQRADVVVLDDGLRVTRVMRAGHWVL